MTNESTPIAAAHDDPTDRPLSDARSVFVSDVHLGSRFSQVGPLLELLDRCLPRHLYVVGDLFDSRRLRRRPYWSADCTRLMARLFDFGVSGTSLHLAPGNHDTFLREFAEDYRLFDVKDTFIHECASGQRLMVMHGDQFDTVESKMKWLSHLGSSVYEGLLTADRSLNWAIGLVTGGRRKVPLSRGLKNLTKRIVQKKSGFYDKTISYAKDHGCNAILCGHIHRPEMQTIDDVLYCNTGDWIEHCTAIVEWPDGTLELIDMSKLSGAKRKRPIVDRLKKRFSKSRRKETPARARGRSVKP